MCHDDTFDVKLLHGNQAEVINQLRVSHAEQFVVLEVGDLSNDAFASLTTNMQTFTTSMGSLLTHAQLKNNIDQIVSAMLPVDIPTPIVMREAAWRPGQRQP